nr:molybdopterin-guanine dinucleotide biosynthesis protein B [Neobacillus sp. Marseille-Q6967]
MALVKPVIFQVVGYQNSGKTTFVLKLIQTLSKQGFKTVTIKHHGHGGKPEVVEQKDSSRHIMAGAAASIVEGDGSLLLQANVSEAYIEDQIRLMEVFNPDVILIEGHKNKSYPKVLFLRNSDEFSLLSKLKNIKFVITWDKEILFRGQELLKVPIFHIEDENSLLHVVKDLMEEVHKRKNRSK